MKQRLKQITKFIAICALVVLSSCEKDLYEEGIKQNNNLKIEQKSFQELLLNKKFNSAYKKVEKSKISKKGDLQERTQLKDDYNFTIVEQSPVKILTNESDGSVTYVMLIERPISENLKFENLILNDKNGILDGRIIKYTLSKEPEKDELHGGEILDIIDTEMTTLEIEGRIAIPCVITYTLMCDNTAGGTWSHDHIATQTCIDANINLYVTTQVECGGGGNSEGTFGGPPSGGNTGSGPTGPIGSVPSTGNTNTGPNGNGGGIGTTPSIPTSPISPFGSNEMDNINPCEKVNNLKNDTKFQQKMNDLSNAAKNYKFERVYTVYDNPNPINTSTTIDNYNFFPFNGNVYNPSASYTYSTNIKGLIHSHYEGLFSIFSSPDLQDLYNILLNPSITSDFFYGVVTEDGTSYIITISDRTKFINFGNKYLSNYQDFKDFEVQIFNKKYNIKPDNSVATNELGFLKMMSDLDIGINFYSGNEDRTLWEKKVYNPTTNQVSPTNCN